MSSASLQALSERVAQTMGGELRSGDGETLIRLSAGRFAVECEPSVSDYSILLDCSVFDEEFGSLLRKIDETCDETPISWFQIAEPSGVSERSLSSALSAAVRRAEELRFESLLDSFTQDPSGKGTNAQLCHLAALALRGDFVRLMEYRDAFTGAARNPFVPVISQAQLERAIDQALERS